MCWEVRSDSDTWFLAPGEIHVRPTEDMIMHGWSGCVCLPAQEHRDSGVVIYTHHALDGRELVEVE